MEAREGISGVTVIGAEAPSNYHVAVRSENPSQIDGAPIVGTTVTSSVKKKRGRPRKYGPDGQLSMALTPYAVSPSVSPSIQLSGKRGRGRVMGVENKQPKGLQAENLGGWVSFTAGANFTPHIVTVKAGEDVTMKIISFSQQGPRATCILSANGLISNVTLRQPDSSGGTLTYEGRFEILSLTGSFTPTESGGTRGRAGGLSVSLVSPDGRVVGGSVAGLLVAASPVQVVVGSFIPSNPNEPKVKKQKNEPAAISIPAVSVAAPTSSNDRDDSMGGSGTPNFNTPQPIVRDNWPVPNTAQDLRNTSTDINISLPAV